MKAILERLARLEQQNRSLQEEVRMLRREVEASRHDPASSDVEEKLSVQERRIDEQAQAKVEASQHFPIRLTGMALFNAFANSRQNGGIEYPTIASDASGPHNSGATLRQTVLGLDFQGPQTVWGGKVRGSLFMDLFAGSGQPLGNQLRLRTASIELAWKSTSVMAGQDKPIFSPRDPTSLAQVGVSPLTGAGNLWLWQPLVRLEQRLRFTPQDMLKAQIGVVQTSEIAALANPAPAQLERSRPGLQGRFEISHKFDEERRIEFAPGFHASTTHVAGTSVPSKLLSLDWFANPYSKFEFSGEFFSGQNLAHLGTSTRQGFTVIGVRKVLPVHATGGWAQLTYRATERLSFNFFGGQQDDRNADLRAGAIGKNQAYGANFFYRVAPNVIVSVESSQVRTTYIGPGNRLNNHYDLAVAYLF